MRTHSPARRLRGCWIWAWSILILHAHAARAQTGDPERATGAGTEGRPAWLKRDEPRDADRVWYGWQTLATDGVALLTLGAGGLVRETAHEDVFGYVLPLSFGSYFLGAPIVHAAHDNWGTAAGSLALRLAPISIGMTMITCRSSSLFDRERNTTCEAALATITILGFLVPIALDPVLLAYEDIPKRTQPHVLVTAWFERSGGGITVGNAF